MNDRLKPPTGWSGVALVTIMLMTVAWSIQSAEWVPGLEILGAAVIGAVVVGVVLARLDWMPSPLAHAWSMVLGALWLTFLGTRLLSEYAPPERLEDLATLERMAIVRDRILQWVLVATSGGQEAGEASGMIFVLTTGLLLWLLSYVCVRFLVRYVSFWGAVLPSGFALLANLHYAPDTPSSYLALFLLCALLLSVKTSVTINQDYWRRAGIQYSPDIGLDFLKDGVVVAVAVIGLGYLAPAELRDARLSQFVAGMTESGSSMSSEFNRLFPTLNMPTRGSGGAYTDEMPLTGSIDLGSGPIFDVHVEGEPPRYYRMAVFDTYSGSGWTRHAERDVPMSDLAIRPPAMTRAVSQTIETFQPSTSQLFSAPQPFDFSLAAQASVAGPESDPDVLAIRPDEPLTLGATYTAVSYQSEAAIDQLRSASDQDPDWVAARYLPLPESEELDQVAELAAELVAETTNRYDAADAIENHLRQIEYSETISAPPSDQDRVHWFLFDEQRGYCDYFSSAFVVMARSVGIPARVAAGYSIGSYSQASGAYRQHASDAHSWAEVYFPGYGWIEFEPTGADSEIDRAAEGAAGPTPTRVNPPVPDRDDMLPDDELDDASTLLDQPAEGASEGPRWSMLLAQLLGLMVIGAAMAFGLRTAWERPFRGLSPAEAAFARVIRLASWIGLRPRRQDTPYEYGERLGRAIPEAERHVTTIANAYVQERFGSRAPEDPSRLSQAWQAVRRPLLRLAARTGLSRLLRR